MTTPVMTKIDMPGIAPVRSGNGAGPVLFADVAGIVLAADRQGKMGVDMSCRARANQVIEWCKA